MIKEIFDRVIKTGITALLLGLSASAIGAQQEQKPVTFTEKDREAILKMYSETQEHFRKSIEGLSAEQLAFRPHEKSWTIAEVGEHIVLAESEVRKLIDNTVLKAELNEDPSVFRFADGAITLAVTNRNQKFQAPDFVQPKKALSTTKDLIDGMSKARKVNTDFLSATKLDLRNHFAQNPLFGTLDAYQWFIFLNGHTERHLAQIEEIKSHADYPSK